MGLLTLCTFEKGDTYSFDEKKVLYSRNFPFSHGGDGDDVRCSKSDGVGETGDSGHVEDTHRRRGGGMISRCRGLGGMPT